MEDRALLRWIVVHEATNGEAYVARQDLPRPQHTLAPCPDEKNRLGCGRTFSSRLPRMVDPFIQDSTGEARPQRASKGEDRSDDRYREGNVPDLKRVREREPHEDDRNEA